MSAMAASSFCARGRPACSGPRSNDCAEAASGRRLAVTAANRREMKRDRVIMAGVILDAGGESENFREKFPRSGMVRLVEDLVGRAGFEDVAAVHEHDL